MASKLLKLSIVFVLVFASCSKDETIQQDTVAIPVTQKEPLTAKQVNAQIDEALSRGGFNWNNASDHLLWSASVNGQNLMTIGFGNSKNDFERAKSANNAQIQQSLLSLIMQYEGRTLDKTLVAADPYLNLIDVVISKQETIIALRKSNLIRYIEPADYRYFALSLVMATSTRCSPCNNAITAYKKPPMQIGGFLFVTVTFAPCKIPLTTPCTA